MRALEAYAFIFIRGFQQLSSLDRVFGVVAVVALVVAVALAIRFRRRLNALGWLVAALVIAQALVMAVTLAVRVFLLGVLSGGLTF